MKIDIDEKMLKILKERDAYGGTDEWFIASSIFDWDGKGNRKKHGAWIRCVIQAGIRLQNKGLVGHFMVSHGQPGYNAPDSRLWFLRGTKYLQQVRE